MNVVSIQSVANQMAPDSALKQAFLSVFGIMTEQASKMGMGDNSKIINFYDRFQVRAAATLIEWISVL